MYRARTVREMERRWEKERQELFRQMERLMDRIMVLSNKPMPEYEPYEAPKDLPDYESLVYAEARLLEEAD